MGEWRGWLQVFPWNHCGEGQGPVWYRHRRGTVCGEAEFTDHTTTPSHLCLCGSSGSAAPAAGIRNQVITVMPSFTSSVTVSPFGDRFLNTECCNPVQCYFKFFSSPLLRTGRRHVHLNSCFLLWQGYVLGSDECGWCLSNPSEGGLSRVSFV